MMENNKQMQVFITFSKTDASGKRTRESVSAKQLARRLESSGVRVFLKQTFEGQPSAEEEKALEDAQILVLVAGKTFLIQFVWRNGKNHASPNSGYPEAALAGILNCRFGGPHFYFGQLFPKPYIGENERPLTTRDMKTAVRVNRATEVIMVLLVACRYLI